MNAAKSAASTAPTIDDPSQFHGTSKAIGMAPVTLSLMKRALLHAARAQSRKTERSR